MSSSIRATGAVGTEAVNITRDVVKGALAATEDLGTGLVVTTKSVAKGVALGVSDVGGDVISAASETARAAVNATSAVGGDTLMVAKRTLDGVVEATNETGGNAVETARAVASSAAEAVGGFGTTAVSSVRDILLGVVTGVKDVANAALPRSTGPLDERDRTSPPDRTDRPSGSRIVPLLLPKVAGRRYPRLHPTRRLHAGRQRITRGRGCCSGVAWLKTVRGFGPSLREIQYGKPDHPHGEPPQSGRGPLPDSAESA